MQAEYEAAGERYVNAKSDLARARHLLELAEIEMDQAEANLAQYESSPGIPMISQEA